ncbi:ABC transporter ATP-binding protein [Telmatospirillum sp.]|uniref:ABC transporter ATP-binding protein n=1 Tax=Telmatospirillum sp. TaxID=2079197 RepID=UPI00284DB586|nr:ABC transporter ATP-binding protein [Telmatospirillum sp.]MDR3437910.1 ABC transporter ATP-binding protein [Telmatospirillum sp.]
MSIAPPVVAIKGVSHAYRTTAGDEVVALKDLDFEIEKNEFVAIVGPSGCGKSSVLRLIAGLQRPTRGQVRIYGYDVTEPREDIGFVFQRPTLLPWKCIIDNVLFPLQAARRTIGADDRQRAMFILGVCGLADFAQRMPHELSGGMQQRAAIARSLFHDPGILLMDEPFGALDALTREILGIELLQIVESRRKTVVFVTHSIPEAVFLADRVVVMTGRPGQVTEIINVDIPRPRTVQHQSWPQFHACAERIRSHIYGNRPTSAAHF